MLALVEKTKSHDHFSIVPEGSVHPLGGFSSTLEGLVSNSYLKMDDLAAQIVLTNLLPLRRKATTFIYRQYCKLYEQLPDF